MSDVAQPPGRAVDKPRAALSSTPRPVVSAAAALADAEADLVAFSAWTERGDREALQRVFTRHAEAALRLAQHRLGNLSDADDAVQHAFVGVMRGARNFNPDKGTVRGYLLAAVLNACAQQRRAETSRRAREEVAEPPRGTAADPELRDAVRAALAKLPEHQREPVALRYLAGLDFPEIAQALGRNERTVRGQVTRGLETLRQICSRYGLAAGTTALAVALAALAPPASGADAVERLAAVARSGPRAARTTAIARHLGIAALIAAAIALAAWLMWPATRPSVAVPPPEIAVPLRASPAAPAAPAVAADAPPDRTAGFSRIAWNLPDDVPQSELPVIAVGAARAADDPSGVGTAWWTERRRRPPGWSWGPITGDDEPRAGWTPARLLRAAHAGEHAYLLLTLPTSDDGYARTGIPTSLVSNGKGWAVTIDAVRVPRQLGGSPLLQHRGSIAYDLGPLQATDQRVTVEVRWRDQPTYSTVIPDRAEIARGEMVVHPATLPDGPPATLDTLAGVTPAPASSDPERWWQVPLAASPIGLSPQDAPPAYGGLLLPAGPLQRQYLAAGGEMRSDVVLVLGPPVASSDAMSLRSVRWDHDEATLTVSVWTPLPDATRTFRRPLMPVLLERPPGASRLVTVRLEWERFAADDAGDYVRRPLPDAEAGTVRLRDVELPEPRAQPIR
jgi:RNA polymerase sigma-70 factor (ECF subfamily)